MCSGSTWPPSPPDRSSFQHTVIYENVRLFVCRVLKITRPVFLPPNYLSPISLHHSHYLSTESHSDINNPPLSPWKLNDALQLPRCGRVWCQTYCHHSWILICVSGRSGLICLDWFGLVQFSFRTLFCYGRTVVRYVFWCLRYRFAFREPFLAQAIKQTTLG